MNQRVTLARLKELLHYDPVTGVFTWRVTHHRIRAGDRAGYANPGGKHGQPWRAIEIDQINYRESRLAWFYMTGEWPTLEMDHRDVNPLNNKWANLRLATSSQNKANRKRAVNNRSGFKGVHPCGKRFYARAKVHGKYQHLGMFDTAEAAFEKYKAVTTVLYGEYARYD